MVNQQSHIDSAMKLPGVLAVAIVDSAGHVLESECTPPYDPVLFEESFSGVLAVMEQRQASGSTGPDRRALQVSLDEGYFFIREMEDEWLSVITDHSVHISRLNVALNVIEARRAARSEAELPEPEPIVTPRSTGPIPAISEQRIQGAAVASRSSEQLLTRLYGNRPGIVDRAAMEHLIKVSSRHFGERTSEILRLEMAALQVSPSACSSQDFRDLIRRLCIHLDKPNATRFADEVLGD